MLKKVFSATIIGLFLMVLTGFAAEAVIQQKDLPKLKNTVKRVMQAEGLEPGHIALDLFSDNQFCATVDVQGKNMVLSLLFRLDKFRPILIQRDYVIVGTEVSENIGENTTWTSEEGPYYITNDIDIHGDVTLDIEPGTVVMFRKFTSPHDKIRLHVNGGGQLNCNNARFTTSCPFEHQDEIQSLTWESVDWRAIQADYEANVYLHDTTIEYANQALDNWERQGDIQVHGCNIWRCYRGISTSGWSPAYINNNSITECTDRAIYLTLDVSDEYGEVHGNYIEIHDWAWAGIDVRGGVPNVSWNYIWGEFHNGIYLEDLGPDAWVEYNNVDISGWADHGIRAHSSSCTIAENGIHGNFHNGIRVEYFSGVVQYNQVHGYDSWCGISTWEDAPLIMDNYIGGNFDRAMFLERANPTASGNYMEGNFNIGIDVRDADGIISENQIHNHEDTCFCAIRLINGHTFVVANIITGPYDQIIRVEAGSNAFISDHQLSEADYGVYCVDSEFEITNNNIVGNHEYGVFNETPGDYTINAIENWWGHETGPYHPDSNPSGQGDMVSDGVTFDPWLDEPAF